MANSILASLSVKIDAITAGFGPALNNLSNQLNKFGATVNAQATSISNFEKRIAGIQRTLGSLGVAFGAFQIANIIQDSIRKVADFEHQMREVQAITGATAQDFARLRDDALRLGAASKFTATEVAQLQAEFGRLGFTTEEILAATEATIELATATGEDLARSADVAGSTVRAFGLQAEETQRVVDVMAESFNRTALGLDNYAEAIKFVAPVSRAANISIEETTALLGVLADAGVRGSQAGTALRRIITDLAKDGRPLQERLKELAAQGLDLGGAMDEVGRNAQTALLVLTNNVDRIGELTQGLRNAEGAAAATAKIMRDDLTGDLEALTSAWDGFILSLDKSDGSVRETIQSLTQLVEAITRISNSGFGEFVADWFRFTQFIPRFLIGAIDMFSRWGEEVEITKEQAGQLFYELNRLKEAAELEGRTEEAEKYATAIKQITDKFGDLSKEVGTVGPQLQQVVNPELLVLFNNAAGETTGIIGGLEKKAKDLGDQIKKATSIAEIRRLQHELEGVKLRIDAILNPSTPPEPIKNPIEFEVPDLSIDGDEGRKLLDAVQKIIPKDGLVIPIRPEIDPEQLHKEATSEAIKEKLNEIGQAATQNALAINDALASVIDSAISGQQTFAAALGAVTLDVLQQFQRQALGAALAAYFSSPTPKPFPVLLLGAGLAIAAVKALFRRATGVGGGGGGGVGGGGGLSSSNNFERERADTTVSTIEIIGTTRIEGNDLLISWGRAQDRNNFTRPGG